MNVQIVMDSSRLQGNTAKLYKPFMEERNENKLLFCCME